MTGRLVFANLRLPGRLDRVVRYPTLNRLQTWIGQRLSPGVAGDGVTTRRLVEEAPTVPRAEFVEIADSVAGFPRSDFDASRITAPTLVLHGEHVPAAFREAHGRLAESLTGAEVAVTVVPGAGHASNVDNPAFFTDAVGTFARGVTDAGS